MVRKSVVAGTFYSDDLGKLDQEIKKCFVENQFGPGDLPVNRRDKKVIGVISPHASYKFSGAGQAWCYKEIGESELADIYVILGTSHSGFEKAATIIEDFETPFGMVSVDENFARKLIEKGSVIENRLIHQNEHSIEVQLPFLQFVNKEKFNFLKIVPIVIGKEINYEKLGLDLANIIKETGKRVVIICSSDFIHYGVSHGYIPFRENIKEKLKEKDLNAIKWIKELDSWGFMNYIEETKANICGVHAIAVFIEACKALGANKVRLEQYYSSGDVTQDWDNAVGYASIIVE